MKNFTLNHFFKVLALSAIASGSMTNSYGQLTERSYGTRQTTRETGVDILGSFNNETFAVDADPKTASSFNLGIGVVATKEQIIDFNPSASATGSYSTTIAANTPITVKLNLPAGLLAVLSGIEVQAITNLNRTGAGNIISPYVWNYTNVGTAYNAATIAGVASGAGTTEITITPSAAYQGIRVRISGVVGLAFGISVYHAYVKVPATGNIACANRIDVLSGVKAGTVVGGIANATGSVLNPWDAVDNDTTTFSHLMTGAAVLSQAYHTTIFNTPSKVGDTLKILTADPNNSILDLSLLSGFRINLYNGSGTTPVQTIQNNSPLLTLRLLGGPANKAYFVTVPNAVFDRAEIVIGGVASAFSELNIYDVNKENAGVNLTAAQANVYAYAGQDFSLAATAIATDDVVSFYDAEVNGNVVSPTTITSTTAQANTVLSYYGGTTRNGCTETSKRKKVSAHIVGFNQNYPVAGIIDSTYTGNIILSNTATLPLTPGFKYMAQSALPPGLALNSKTGAITGTPTAITNLVFNVQITDTVNNLPVGTFLYYLPITANNNNPLNSSLVGFSCNDNGQQIDLNWITVSEANNKGFSIEKSVDGRTFKTIGFVNSQYESGTGSVQKQYTFADKNPQSGVNYYRLNQTDFSGKSKLSDVISLTISKSAVVTVYPNPVKDLLNIQTENGAAVYIYNAIGQLVSAPIVNAANNIIIFDTKNLANGLYTVKVVSNNTATVKNVVVKH